MKAVPTGKTVRKSEGITNRNKANAVKRAKSSVKEFKSWLKTTDWRLVTKPLVMITQPATFKCRKCGAEKSLAHCYSLKKSQQCLTCNFDAKLPADYKRVSEYKSTYVRLQHKCGLVKEFNPETFLRGSSACICAHKHIFITDSQYKELARELRGVAFKVEGEYTSGKTPIWHRHVGGCGKRFKQLPNYFLSGKYCPLCERDPVVDHDIVAKAVVGAIGKDYSVVDSNGMSDKATILHKFCGKTFSLSPSYIVHKAKAEIICPHCRTGPGSRYELHRKGKRFMLQGTERFALDWILDFYKVSPQDVIHGRKVPRFTYEFNGKTCNYTPDFWIKSKNLILESKDWNSFGMTDFFWQTDLVERNQEKAKAVISSGYRFKMLVFNKGIKIMLPKGWLSKDRKSIAASLAKAC